MTLGCATFDTALGACALVWRDARIVGVLLPEADAAATARRLAERWPDAAPEVPPPWLQPVIEGIVALLRGEPVDLSTAPLALDGVPAFERAVYERVRRLPPGETRTYGEIAADLGEPGAARAVGQAMGRNPFPILVPCHRVVAAGGRPGGFSAPGGAQTKQKMLAIEGVRGRTLPLL